MARLEGNSPLVFLHDGVFLSLASSFLALGQNPSGRGLENQGENVQKECLLHDQHSYPPVPFLTRRLPSQPMRTHTHGSMLCTSSTFGASEYLKWSSGQGLECATRRVCVFFCFALWC